MEKNIITHNNGNNYSSIAPVNGELISDNIILGEYISNNTRSKFITKVYNIVFCQLLITCLSMGLFIKIPVFNEFAKSPLANSILFLSFCILINLCLFNSENNLPFDK